MVQEQNTHKILNDSSDPSDDDSSSDESRTTPAKRPRADTYGASSTTSHGSSELFLQTNAKYHYCCAILCGHVSFFFMIIYFSFHLQFYQSLNQMMIHLLSKIMIKLEQNFKYRLKSMVITLHEAQKIQTFG